MLLFGFVLLAICLVFGWAFVLLRMAKGFKEWAGEDGDSNGW